MARELIIKEAFKDRYGDTPFINDPKTDSLIAAIATPANIRKVVAFCMIGEPPIAAVIHDIEFFAVNNGIVENGVMPEEWMENVGKLIAAIAYFIGYTKDAEKNLKCIPIPVYFKTATTFR